MIDKIHYGDNGDAKLINRNPISPCPDSPNCVRLSKQYSIDVKDLIENVEKVLKKMGAVKIDINKEKYHISSVFRVFIFKDDMLIDSETYESGSILHIRSSSRVGYGDLGVNKRRVKKFLRELDHLIKEPESK